MLSMTDRTWSSGSHGRTLPATTPAGPTCASVLCLVWRVVIDISTVHVFPAGPQSRP